MTLYMTNSEPLLSDFVDYCLAHPAERFWQALRNWSGHCFTMAADRLDDIQTAKDTFYWNSKDGSRQKGEK